LQQKKHFNISRGASAPPPLAHARGRMSFTDLGTYIVIFIKMALTVLFNFKVLLLWLHRQAWLPPTYSTSTLGSSCLGAALESYHKLKPKPNYFRAWRRTAAD